MVQLSTEVQLIKPVCTSVSTTSNIKHLKRFIGRSQQRNCVCQQSRTSRPLLHLCDHDSTHFPVSHCAPLDRLETCSGSVSVTSHIATSIWPRYPFRPTNSPHLIPQSPCPGSEIVCTAALRCSSSSCPSSFSPFTAFSLRSNTKPLHCLSCRSLWTGGDFVPKSGAQWRFQHIWRSGAVALAGLASDTFAVEFHVDACGYALQW